MCDDLNMTVYCGGNKIFNKQYSVCKKVPENLLEYIFKTC